MKFRIAAFLIICLSISMQAQNAGSILDKASAAYNNAGGITANFTLDSKNTKTKQTFSSDGKAYLKGNKFKLETPEGITWFDGKTQWVYIKDSEEVNISTPTGEELQSISPAAIFNMYKNGFNLAYKGEKNIKGKRVLEVEMTPQKKNQDISRINVQIDKGTNIFSSITITDKSGLQNTITINKLQTGTNLSDNMFIFIKKNYPDVEVIDLR